MINWNGIDTVLLDMDGTLLDLHFDSDFWQRRLPQHYAKRHGLHPEAAHSEMMQRYEAVLGTIDWYCLDYWSRTLDMDVAALKHDSAHLIAMHPHVIEFLVALHNSGKRRVLVTNAHHDSLALKLRLTPLGRHLDDIICAHRFGMPKENPQFWRQLQRALPFNPQRTLLIDDSLAVLRSARGYGIAHLLAVAHPDSRAGRKDTGEFAALPDFAAIMPGPRS